MGAGPDGQPSVPCPLAFTDAEITRQQEEYEKWASGVELKAQVLQEMGAYSGWDGWIKHRLCDDMRRQLENTFQRFLDREARSDEERAEWIRAWPLQDC